jgi:sporulation protein YlmC with PRC-barrel domain
MNSNITLNKLGDTELTVATPSEDIRGRNVKDKDDNDVGKVEDLLIDDSDRKVRFMQVQSGGFLGMGETKSFIPIDAITRVTDDNVYINQSREHVTGAPRYAPDLTQRDYYGSLYDYYGHAPYWGLGYTYPDYPYYRG